MHSDFGNERIHLLFSFHKTGALSSDTACSDEQCWRFEEIDGMNRGQPAFSLGLN
jgi:hypothetical protein